MECQSADIYGFLKGPFLFKTYNKRSGVVIIKKSLKYVANFAKKTTNWSILYSGMLKMLLFEWCKFEFFCCLFDNLLVDK